MGHDFRQKEDTAREAKNQQVLGKRMNVLAGWLTWATIKTTDDTATRFFSPGVFRGLYNQALGFWLRTSLTIRTLPCLINVVNIK